MALGKKAAVLRGDAVTALAETKNLSSMLVKLGVPNTGLPIIDPQDKFVASYKSIMLLQSRANDCIPGLMAADLRSTGNGLGVPRYALSKWAVSARCGF